MKQLMLEVDAFKARRGSASDGPLARSRRPAASAEQHGVQGGIGLPADEPAGETPGERTRRRAFPLALVGYFGSVVYKDKPMFEDKLATTEFQYDGVKGGAAWKTKVERYMVNKAPVLKELGVGGCAGQRHQQRLGCQAVLAET